MEYMGTRYGGYYMEYPTLEQAEHYSRELCYDERITVLSQGFHFGASIIRCYSFREFVEAVGKREYKNPAGGVRALKEEEIVPWLERVIGDEELACAVSHIYRDNGEMQVIMDRLSTVLYVRERQYDEVIAYPEDCEEA